MISSLCKATLVVALAALSLSGCASRVHSPYVSSMETPRLVPVGLSTGTSRFDYRRTNVTPAATYEGENDGYWIRSLTWPSVGENGQDGNLVTTRYYQSKAPGTKPLLIVLPIWGKYTYPPNTIADHVMDRSGGAVDVIQVLGEDFLFDWEDTATASSEAEFLSKLDRMAGRMVTTVIDIRRVVDWAWRQPGVDRRRIGLVGFSISAVAGSLIMANEPRLGAGALIMGGANLHEALANCGSLLGQMRTVITDRFGWTVEQYRDKVEAPLAPINPLRYASMVDPRRVLIVEAAHDSCLTAPGREQLWRAMGQPERISYLYDHKMAFMSMTFFGGNDLQKQIYGFLERTFLLDTPGVRYEADRPSAGPADN